MRQKQANNTEYSPSVLSSNGSSQCAVSALIGCCETRVLRARLVLNTCMSIGNESVPKIVINDTTFYFETAISILVILNHNSFRVLFDKIAFVYQRYISYFSIGNVQVREPALCQLYRHAVVANAAGVYTNCSPVHLPCTSTCTVSM